MKEEKNIVKLNPTFFILKLFTLGKGLKDVVREQYELSRNAGISLTESDDMPDFEREVYINILLSDLKREADMMNSSGGISSHRPYSSKMTSGRRRF